MNPFRSVFPLRPAVSQRGRKSRAVSRRTAERRSAAPRALVFVVLCALLVGGVASGQAVSGEDRYVVAFAQDTLANDWRLAQARDLERALSGYPGIRFILSDAGGSSAKQVQHIEDFTDQEVDVLVVSPRDVAVMTPALSRAHRRGIPVVLITRRILGESYTSFIGPDDEAIAAQAARFIAERLDGVGRVLMLQGVPTASTAVDRTRGFEREIARYPEIRVVEVLTANYLRGDALREMDRFLTEHGGRSAPDDLGFDAIYAQSDSMAAGARLALMGSGYDPSRIVTVGIDYVQEAREAIRAGTQTATFLYPTSSHEAARVVIDILEGNEVPRAVPVPSVLVTADNVEDVEPIF
jgi:ribose transport system substrate-binding protein